MVLGRLERALEVVEHRQELHDDPLARARDERLLVARRALAVVVEVGGEAPQVVEVLVALRLGVLQAREQLLDVVLDASMSRSTASAASPGAARPPASVGARLAHVVFAASSSSITS